MKIEETTREFLSFVLEDEPELEDLGKLMEALDKLAYSANCINYVFDETEYAEAPDTNGQLIREKVRKRFPALGLYNIPQHVSENLEKSRMIVGDAMDDISEIVGDLSEVMWRFENTSKNDALWHYEISFRSHWGNHLRALQLYLHDKWW